MKYITLILSASFLLSGCSYLNNSSQNLSHISQGDLKKVSWDEMKELSDDEFDKGFDVFLKDCKSPKNNLQDLCLIAQESNNSKSFFIDYFNPYKLYDDKKSDKGIITGYYEPLLYGSRTKTEIYKYPIYKIPKDLVTFDIQSFIPNAKSKTIVAKVIENKLTQYDTRAQINNRTDIEPICFVDNKIDLFFLHIQGSGRIVLDTNETIYVGFKSHNGKDYFAIGKKLIEDHGIKKEDISLESIQNWLENHKEKADSILNLNERYIFFEESNKSASGSLGVELVGKKNIAVDTSVIPLGYPVYLKTTNPLTKEKINSIVIAADTGGAIKGKIRADYFCGFGEEAKNLAGVMKEEGELFLFIPKNR